MAGPLAAMERFFERIFERPAARLLAPRLEAVHLQRPLERAMESGRIRRAGRWYVPSRYRVLLHPADLVALSGREALPAELAEMLRDYARRRGHVLETRPSIRLEGSPRIASGDVAVLAEDDGLAQASRSSAVGRRPTEDSTGSRAVAAPPDDPPSGPAEPAPDDEQLGSSTSVFRATRPTVPQATISVRVPGQEVKRVPVDGRSLRIGRSPDNDIVLADPRVSRHHGQISVRLGTLIYTDHGSTNGSFLHGSRVEEIALGPHDVLQLGGSSLTIEPTVR